MVPDLALLVLYVLIVHVVLDCIVLLHRGLCHVMLLRLVHHVLRRMLWCSLFNILVFVELSRVDHFDGLRDVELWLHHGWVLTFGEVVV